MAIFSFFIYQSFVTETFILRTIIYIIAKVRIDIFFNSPHMEKLNFLVTETRWCRYITK